MRPQDRPIIEALAEQLQGRQGVRTPAGRVDLVTQTEVIMVAHDRYYREAIDAARAAREFLPLTARVHLWGDSGGEGHRGMVGEIAGQVGVIVTWEVAL